MWTFGHDAANSHFSQLRERAKKSLGRLTVCQKGHKRFLAHALKLLK
jgi:hypothetical protein